MTRVAKLTRSDDLAVSASSRRTRPSLRLGSDSTATIMAVLSLSPWAAPRDSLPTNTSSKFDNTRQQVPFGADHGASEFVQPRPRGLVRPKSQHPLQAQRGHAVLLRGDEPDRGEPRRQRGADPMEDRPCGHRGLPATGRAHPSGLRRLPGLRRAARRTEETVRPPQPGQVLQAGEIVREPRLELLERPGIVDSADRMRTNGL